MDRNLQAAIYLQQLTPERLPLVDNLAFRTQLQKVRFDYTLASLAQVDDMLGELRGSMRMAYGDFLQKQPAVNFIVALNFYLGTTIARLGSFAIKWLDHAQVAQHMPGVPEQLETDTGCVIGDAIVFPAAVVLERLFAPQPERTCAGFAARLIERLTQEGQRLPDPVPRPSGAPDASVPALLRDALEGAGFLGAWGIGTLADGSPVGPVALVPQAGGQRTLIDFSTFGSGDLQQMVSEGLRRLAVNSEGGPWQALHYDGYVNLPAGRRDALIVELRVYEGAAPVDGAAPLLLSLTVALPYRPANDPAGFANFSPRLVSCSQDGPVRAALLDHFYRGIYSAKHFAWDARFAGD